MEILDVKTAEQDLLKCAIFNDLMPEKGQIKPLDHSRGFSTASLDITAKECHG